MAASKKPSHTIYTVREGKGEGAKGYWIEIGSAWTNADGSLSLAFDALPVNGRAVLRQRVEKADSLEPTDA